MGDKPLIFINGLHRSGTTLLSRVVNAFPGVFIVEDGFRIPWIFLQVEHEETLTYPRDLQRKRKLPIDLAKPIANAEKFKTILRNEICRDLRFRPEVEKKLLAFVETVNGGRPYRDVFRDLFGVLAAATGSPVVGTKHTQMSYYRREILSVFPEARWIEIVRDPRGWYCSSKVSHPMRSAIRAAWLWQQGYKAFARELASGEGRTLLITFEDLIVRRSEALNRLAEFAGIEFRASEEWLKDLRLVGNDGVEWQANSSYEKKSGLSVVPTEATSSGRRGYDLLDPVPVFRWRKQLSATEKFLVAALTYPVRRRLGLQFGQIA